jgi:hypothetical protein
MTKHNKELFSFYLPGAKRSRPRLGSDSLPVELWIKIIRHIDDLERFGFTPTTLPCWHFKDPTGYDGPTLKSLRLTSKSFYKICFPLRFEAVICADYDYFSDAKERTSPQRLLDDPRIPPLVSTLDWTPRIYTSPGVLLTTTRLRSLHLRKTAFSTILGNEIFSLPRLAHLALTDSLYDFYYTDQNFSTSVLISLAIQEYSSSSGLLRFVGFLHHLQQLKELEISPRITGSVFDHLLSNPTSSSLKLDRLAITGQPDHYWGRK